MNLTRLGTLACAWSLLAGLAVPNAVSQANTNPAEAAPEQVKPSKAQAYYHYSLGHIYQERGAAFNRPDLLAKAIDEFKLALQYDPDSSYLSLELADLYAASGRWRNALEEAEEHVSRHPDDLEARKLLGRLYVRMLMPSRGERPPEDLQERAVKQFEQILLRDPKDVSSYLILSQLYRLGGDNAKAESILKKAIAMQPDSSEANANLAMLYVDMGDFRAAIDLLKGVSNSTADAQVWGTLAYAYEQVQDYKNSASAYSRALQRDPDNLAYRRGLGNSLLYSKQYDPAREQFESLLEANPRDIESYLRVSQIYRVQGKFDLAQQNLTKALELAPDNPEILLNQVMLMETQGKIPEAISLVQKILDASSKQDASPYTPQEKASRGVFLEKLGTLYRDHGDFTNAENSFRQMLSLGQDNAMRAQLQLLQTYEENKQFDKALEESERAVKQYPESRELVAQRASLLATTGRGPAAIALLKPLLKNTPQDREIWLAMARVYQQAKEFDQARDAISKGDDLSENEGEKQYIRFIHCFAPSRSFSIQKSRDLKTSLISLYI